MLTRKQTEIMNNKQLTDFAIKLQNDMTSIQTELIIDDKEFRKKLHIIDSIFGKLKN